MVKQAVNESVENVVNTESIQPGVKEASAYDLDSLVGKVYSPASQIAQTKGLSVKINALGGNPFDAVKMSVGLTLENVAAITGNAILAMKTASVDALVLQARKVYEGATWIADVVRSGDATLTFEKESTGSPVKYSFDLVPAMALVASITLLLANEESQDTRRPAILEKEKSYAEMLAERAAKA